jgi:uncharacterized protein YjbJ (UPF0337 family)
VPELNFLPQGDGRVNWDAIKANWTQLRGRVRMQWGKLTDDRLDVIEGRREVLLGQLQEAYGISEAEADQQVAAWENADFAGEDAAGTSPRRAT